MRKKTAVRMSEQRNFDAVGLFGVIHNALYITNGVLERIGSDDAAFAVGVEFVSPVVVGKNDVTFAV